MRIIARFEKREAVRFISHLDIQRLFQRAFRRAQIPLAYSQGFNPHPLLAFATALSVGYTSEAEWLDIKTETEFSTEQFIQDVNAALPEGFCIVEALRVEDNFPSLSTIMAAAEYTLSFDEECMPPEELPKTMLAQESIFVVKKTKAGMRNVDIRPLLLDAKSVDARTIRILGRLDAAGSLNIELLLRAMLQQFDDMSFFVHRNCIYSADGSVMPIKPERLS